MYRIEHQNLYVLSYNCAATAKLRNQVIQLYIRSAHIGTNIIKQINCHIPEEQTETKHLIKYLAAKLFHTISFIINYSQMHVFWMTRIVCVHFFILCGSFHNLHSMVLLFPLFLL